MYRRISVGLVALAIQFSPAVSAQGDARLSIRELSAVVRDGRVILDIEAQGLLDARSLERLESGLPLEYRYQVEILNRRRGWFDKARGSAEIGLQAVYDAVSREYTVTRRLDGELFDVESARSLDELEPLLTRLHQFPVLQVTDVPLGDDPELRVRIVSSGRTWRWLIPRPIAGDWNSVQLVLEPTVPPTPTVAS